MHVAGWSKDTTQVGAVLAIGNRVVGLGYNGLPAGVKDHPDRLLNRDIKYAMTVHAEANALRMAGDKAGRRRCTPGRSRPVASAPPWPSKPAFAASSPCRPPPPSPPAGGTPYASPRPCSAKPGSGWRCWMNSPLPPDEPRCHDPLCNCRQSCRRWLEREGHALRHYAIMRPKYHCNTEPCAHHLPAEAADASA
jgi:hypothetical protein